MHAARLKASTPMNALPLKHPVRAPPPTAAAAFALWHLGFRPFYLLASIFSAFSMLLWTAQFSGYLPAAYLAGPLWHGHEMLFGYTTAVMTRTARGHTGRPLIADRFELTAFLPIQIAAVARVFGPMLAPGPACGARSAGSFQVPRAPLLSGSHRAPAPAPRTPRAARA